MADPKRRGRGTSLRRRAGTRAPKKRVLVVCEGEKTEPQYLRHVNGRAREALIELEIVDERSTSPKRIVERGCQMRRDAERARRRTKDPNAAIEEVWCVFDVDEHANIREAKLQAQDNGVNVAISNPSIEIWFALHFVDCFAWTHRDAAKELVLKHIPDYDKKFLSIDPLLGRYEVARDRAQRLEAKHEGDETQFPHDNPSTGIWRLVESLRAEY